MAVQRAGGGQCGRPAACLRLGSELEPLMGEARPSPGAVAWNRGGSWGYRAFPGAPGRLVHRLGLRWPVAFTGMSGQCGSWLPKPWALCRSDQLLGAGAGAPGGSQPAPIPRGGDLLAHRGVGRRGWPGSPRAGRPLTSLCTPLQHISGLERHLTCRCLFLLLSVFDLVEF